MQFAVTAANWVADKVVRFVVHRVLNRFVKRLDSDHFSKFSLENGYFSMSQLEFDCDVINETILLDLPFRLKHGHIGQLDICWSISTLALTFEVTDVDVVIDFLPAGPQAGVSPASRREHPPVANRHRTAEDVLARSLLLGDLKQEDIDSLSTRAPEGADDDAAPKPRRRSARSSDAAASGDGDEGGSPAAAAAPPAAPGGTDEFQSAKVKDLIDKAVQRMKVVVKNGNVTVRFPASPASAAAAGPGTGPVHDVLRFEVPWLEVREKDAPSSGASPPRPSSGPASSASTGGAVPLSAAGTTPFGRKLYCKVVLFQSFIVYLHTVRGREEGSDWSVCDGASSAGGGGSACSTPRGRSGSGGGSGGESAASSAPPSACGSSDGGGGGGGGGGVGVGVGNGSGRSVPDIICIAHSDERNSLEVTLPSEWHGPSDGDGDAETSPRASGGSGGGSSLVAKLKLVLFVQQLHLILTPAHLSRLDHILTMLTGGGGGSSEEDEDTLHEKVIRKFWSLAEGGGGGGAAGGPPAAAPSASSVGAGGGGAGGGSDSPPTVSVAVHVMRLLAAVLGRNEPVDPKVWYCLLENVDEPPCFIAKTGGGGGGSGGSAATAAPPPRRGTDEAITSPVDHLEQDHLLVDVRQLGRSSGLLVRAMSYQHSLTETSNRTEVALSVVTVGWRSRTRFADGTPNTAVTETMCDGAVLRKDVSVDENTGWLTRKLVDFQAIKSKSGEQRPQVTVMITTTGSKTYCSEARHIENTLMQVVRVRAMPRLIVYAPLLKDFVCGTFCDLFRADDPPAPATPSTCASSTPAKHSGGGGGPPAQGGLDTMSMSTSSSVCSSPGTAPLFVQRRGGVSQQQQQQPPSYAASTGNTLKARVASGKSGAPSVAPLLRKNVAGGQLHASAASSQGSASPSPVTYTGGSGGGGGGGNGNGNGPRGRRGLLGSPISSVSDFEDAFRENDLKRYQRSDLMTNFHRGSSASATTTPPTHPVAHGAQHQQHGAASHARSVTFGGSTVHGFAGSSNSLASYGSGPSSPSNAGHSHMHASMQSMRSAPSNRGTGASDSVLMHSCLNASDMTVSDDGGTSQQSVGQASMFSMRASHTGPSPSGSAHGRGPSSSSAGAAAGAQAPPMYTPAYTPYTRRINVYERMQRDVVLSGKVEVVVYFGEKDAVDEDSIIGPYLSSMLAYHKDGSWLGCSLKIHLEDWEARSSVTSYSFNNIPTARIEPGVATETFAAVFPPAVPPPPPQDTVLNITSSSLKLYLRRTDIDSLLLSLDTAPARSGSGGGGSRGGRGATQPSSSHDGGARGSGGGGNLQSSLFNPFASLRAARPPNVVLTFRNSRSEARDDAALRSRLSEMKGEGQEAGLKSVCTAAADIGIELRFPTGYLLLKKDETLMLQYLISKLVASVSTALASEEALELERAQQHQRKEEYLRSTGSYVPCGMPHALFAVGDTLLPWQRPTSLIAFTMECPKVTIDIRAPMCFPSDVKPPHVVRYPRDPPMHRYVCSTDQLSLFLVVHSTTGDPFTRLLVEADSVHLSQHATSPAASVVPTRGKHASGPGDIDPAELTSLLRNYHTLYERSHTSLSAEAREKAAEGGSKLHKGLRIMLAFTQCTEANPAHSAIRDQQDMSLIVVLNRMLYKHVVKQDANNWILVMTEFFTDAERVDVLPTEPSSDQAAAVVHVRESTSTSASTDKSYDTCSEDMDAPAAASPTQDSKQQNRLRTTKISVEAIDIIIDYTPVGLPARALIFSERIHFQCMMAMLSEEFRSEVSLGDTTVMLDDGHFTQDLVAYDEAASGKSLFGKSLGGIVSDLELLGFITIVETHRSSTDKDLHVVIHTIAATADCVPHIRGRGVERRGGAADVEDESEANTHKPFLVEVEGGGLRVECCSDSYQLLQSTVAHYLSGVEQRRLKPIADYYRESLGLPPPAAPPRAEARPPPARRDDAANAARSAAAKSVRAALSQEMFSGGEDPIGRVAADPRQASMLSNGPLVVHEMHCDPTNISKQDSASIVTHEEGGSGGAGGSNVEAQPHPHDRFSNRLADSIVSSSATLSGTVGTDAPAVAHAGDAFASASSAPLEPQSAAVTLAAAAPRALEAAGGGPQPGFASPTGDADEGEFENARFQAPGALSSSELTLPSLHTPGFSADDSVPVALAGGGGAGGVGYGSRVDTMEMLEDLTFEEADVDDMEHLPESDFAQLTADFALDAREPALGTAAAGSAPSALLEEASADDTFDDMRYAQDVDLPSRPMNSPPAAGGGSGAPAAAVEAAAFPPATLLSGGGGGEYFESRSELLTKGGVTLLRVLLDDYFTHLEPISSALRVTKLKATDPSPALEIVVSGVDFQLNLYGGKDFVTSLTPEAVNHKMKSMHGKAKDSAHIRKAQNLYRTTRVYGQLVTLMCRDVFVMLDLFGDKGVGECGMMWRIKAGARTIDVVDKLTTSSRNRILTSLNSIGEHSDIVMVVLEAAVPASKIGRPDAERFAELSLEVFSEPLRVNIDQDALEFIMRFFHQASSASTSGQGLGATGSSLDAAGGGPPAQPTQPSSAQPAGDTATLGSNGAAPQLAVAGAGGANDDDTQVFFKRVKVGKVNIKLDYSAKRCSTANLVKLDPLALLNLINIEGMVVHLDEIVVVGCWSNVLPDKLAELWWETIRVNDVLAGVPTIRYVFFFLLRSRGAVVSVWKK